LFSVLESKWDIVRNFSPAWFASVMGTGILANTSMFYSSYLPFLRYIAVILWIFNVLLFVVLLVPWVMRWIKYPENAMSDLTHPVNSHFYPTIGIGFIVVAGNFLQIGKIYIGAYPSLVVANVFWVIGSLVTVFFAFLLPYLQFSRSHLKIEHVNPAWFLPTVALMIVPLIGAPVLRTWSAAWQEPLLVFNYFCWSSGFFLYLLLGAIVLYRLIFHEPLPSRLAPTIWINLGPTGAGVMALLALSKLSNSSVQIPTAGLDLFSLIFWSFGIWWLGISIIMTLHYVRRIELPYAMSWWAFIFPLGAYIGASYMLYQVYDMAVLWWIGFVLYWLLFGLWGLTLLRTIPHAYHGHLFMASSEPHKDKDK